MPRIIKKCVQDSGYISTAIFTLVKPSSKEKLYAAAYALFIPDYI